MISPRPGPITVWISFLRTFKAIMAVKTAVLRAIAGVSIITGLSHSGPLLRIGHTLAGSKDVPQVIRIHPENRLPHDFGPIRPPDQVIWRKFERPSCDSVVFR